MSEIRRIDLTDIPVVQEACELTQDEKGRLIDACRLAANLYDDEVEKLQRTSSRSSVSARAISQRASQFRQLADRLKFAQYVMIGEEEI